MTMPKPPTKSALAKEVAAKIHAHLKKWEADKTINKVDQQSKTSRYWNAGAYAVGSTVNVCYVGYQGSVRLTLEQAVRWLAWIEEGNVGEHRRFESKHPTKKRDDLFHVAQETYRPQILDQSKYVYDALGKAYFDFLIAVSEKVPRGKNMSKYDERMIPEVGDFYPSGTSPTFHALPKEAQDAASRLFQEIFDAIYKAYARGRDHGQDLLAQLARGEITPGTFENKVPAKVKRDWRGRITEGDEEEE